MHGMYMCYVRPFLVYSRHLSLPVIHLFPSSIYSIHVLPFPFLSSFLSGCVSQSPVHSPVQWGHLSSPVIPHLNNDDDYPVCRTLGPTFSYLDIN